MPPTNQPQKKGKKNEGEKGLGTGATEVHALDEETLRELGKLRVHNFRATLDATLSILRPGRPRTIFHRER